MAITFSTHRNVLSQWLGEVLGATAAVDDHDGGELVGGGGDPCVAP